MQCKSKGNLIFAPHFKNVEQGELSEWSKEPHSKCGVRITSYRGFESLTLRKGKGLFICLF